VSDICNLSEDDGDPPFASPEIRLNYEAALGRFILEFNQVDNLLATIIDMILGHLGRNDLAEKSVRWDFWLKALVLDLLKHSTEGAGLNDISGLALTNIAKERNKLAHGHFDQNPFSGDYDIVVRNVPQQYSVEKLNALTKEANDLWTALRYAEGHYTFKYAPEMESN
jgi:hypothetical protein